MYDPLNTFARETTGLTFQDFNIYIMETLLLVMLVRKTQTASRSEVNCLKLETIIDITCYVVSR